MYRYLEKPLKFATPLEKGFDFTQAFFTARCCDPHLTTKPESVCVNTIPRLFWFSCEMKFCVCTRVLPSPPKQAGSELFKYDEVIEMMILRIKKELMVFVLKCFL